MQFIKWLDIYEIGVPILDYQHKNLIFILNDTYRAFFLKENKEGLIGEVLDNFIQFYKEHFETEEKFLEMIDYPMIYHQKKMHKEILTILFDFKKQYVEEGEIDLDKFLTLLNSWVFDHLTVEDMKIKEHTHYMDRETVLNYNQKLE